MSSSRNTSQKIIFTGILFYLAQFPVVLNNAKLYKNFPKQNFFRSANDCIIWLQLVLDAITKLNHQAEETKETI